MAAEKAWPLRIVIIGGTSVIARECARLWLEDGAASMTLVGRDNARLAPVADALRRAAPRCAIETRECDFADPRAIQALADQVSVGRAPDIVLIAHGARADQRACEQDLTISRDTLCLNGVSPALFAEAFAGHLEKAGSGTLIVIGSVTGDRGRKGNYVYGAAKGMLERFVEGLAHRLTSGGVRVVLVKPGPTDTPQTAHLRHKASSLARPGTVARGIVNAAAGAGGVVYLPAKWKYIMLVVRHIPRYLFNRLDI